MSGTKHVNDYRDGKALIRFLESNVGRPWNKVYQEICSWADGRTKVGHDLRKRLEWNMEFEVEMRGKIAYQARGWHHRADYPINGLYVHPTTGILCRQKYERPPREKAQPDRLYYYGNFWFESSRIERPAKECGCVHFRFPKEEPGTYRYYRSHREAVAKCIHGREPEYETLWYVVEYAKHDPDEIYRGIYYETASEYDKVRYNLTEPGDYHLIYWRDRKDEKLEYVKSRKSANHKELQIIRQLLAATH